MTVGLRYTNESKDFDATFGNDNTVCVANQALLGAFVNPTCPAFNRRAVHGFAGDPRPVLPGQFDRRAQRRRRSTTSAARTSSPAPACSRTSRTTTCCSTRAIRAAIRRAASTSTARRSSRRPLPFALAGGAQALVGNLQFDPEIVNAYELGGKYLAARGSCFNVALFRQDFKNFQLNTFDGTVFIVQNINGCESGLGGADRDQSVNPGADNFVPPVVSPAPRST